VAFEPRASERRGGGAGAVRVLVARVIGAFVLVGVLGGNLTVGCLNVCSAGECEGVVYCDRYSKGACPTDIGCKIEPACRCDLPDMGESAPFCATCADLGDASTKCGDTAGCGWKAACSGTVLCATFEDENTCRLHNSCGWNKNCG
jgi:hypothetical protein